MFAAPPSLNLEVFTSMPAALRMVERRSEWADINKAGQRLHSFLEGPAFDRNGILHVVDIPFGRILRIDSTGEWEVAAEYDGEPNGLAFHADGRLFIADYKHGILQMDQSGTISPVLLRARSERFRGCNDLTFDSRGNLFFTDQGQTGHQDPTGKVYRLSVDGQLDCLLDTIPSPNGLVLNRAETILYVSVTRANAVWRLPLLDSGRLTSKVGTFVQLSGSLGGPDGLAMDEDDGLVVAHSGLTVWLFDRLGEPALRLRPPTGPFTTNVAFGARDPLNLYVTESSSGTILRAPMPTAGCSLFSHS